MSRCLAAGLALPLLAPLLPAQASSQEAEQAGTYGPAAGFEGEEDTPLPLVEAQPCETQEQEDGVILVCRELTDSERYLSPVPRPVQSDRRIISGLTDPPCWVTNPGAGCIRIGWAPEPVFMVDLTAFPDDLSEEHAALVHDVEGEPLRERPPIGRRVAIDLSEAD